MHDTRNPMLIGTRLTFSSGNTYRILSDPIGWGGSGLLYSAERIICNDLKEKSDGFLYAIKECFPASGCHRTCYGEISPDKTDSLSNMRLQRCKEFMLKEGDVTQRVYRKAIYTLPILDTAEEVCIQFPGAAEKHCVSNTLTVMESLSNKGRPLSSYIGEYGRLTPSQTFHIVQQLLFALREVHEAGFLHLDIQDGNVFVKGALEDRSNIINLIDFGSARELQPDGRTAAIEDRAIFSTRGFTAAEILQHNDGTLRLGPEADIYSVGCLILYLLTGNKYDHDTLLSNTSGKYLTRFKLRKIACPRYLVDRMQAIIAHALEQEPERRYHSTDEMLQDVSDFLSALQPYRSDLSSVDYDAFICYRHGPIDTQVAKLLQHKLEHFRSIGDRKHRRPFHRIFVDEGELSSCADFGAQIRAALKNSGWLIVLCSPETPQSPWVQSEIDTFLEFHDRSRILAVLTEGEPETSFPPQLLGSADGSNQVLAADVRGTHLHEIKRKLSGDSLLRLAAPMLSTTFDSLKQRHRNYILKRATAAAMLLIALISSFSVYAVRKNVEIQNEYRNYLIQQSKYLANLAQQELEKDNPLGALEIALSALPSDGQDRPVVPEAQYTLEQALGVYIPEKSSSTDTVAIGKFPHDNYVESFTVDELNSRCLSRDAYSIYIWDLATHKLLQTIENGSFQEDMVFPESNALLYSDYSSLYNYDYILQENRWSFPLDDGTYIETMVALRGGKEVAAILGNTSDFSVDCVLRLDTQSGKLLRRYDLSSLSAQEEYFTSIAAASPDGRCLAFSIPFQENQPLETKDLDSDHYLLFDDSIVLLDLTTSELTCIPLVSGLVSSMSFLDGSNLLVSTTQGNFAAFDNWTASEENKACFHMIHVPDSSVSWSTSFSYWSFPVYSIIKEVETNPDIVMVSYANHCSILSTEDGHTIRSWEFTGSVIDFSELSSQEGFSVYTSDGSISMCNLNDDHLYSSYEFSENIAHLHTSEGIYYLHYSGSTDVIVYEIGHWDHNWVNITDKILGSSLYTLAMDRNWFIAYDSYTNPNETPVCAYNQDSGAVYTLYPDIIESASQISLIDFWGIIDYHSAPHLVFQCVDDSSDEHRFCFLCFNLETGASEMVYLPIPQKQSITYAASIDPETRELLSIRYYTITQELVPDKIVYSDDTLYFTSTLYDLDQNYDIRETLFLYSWKFGEPEAEEICSFVQYIEEDDYFPSYLHELIPNKDFSHLLCVVKSEEFESGTTQFHVLDFNLHSGKTRILLSATLPSKNADNMPIRQHVSWDMQENHFTFLEAQSIVVCDYRGNRKYTVPYPDAAYTLEGAYLLPDSETLAVITDSGILRFLDISSGIEKTAIELELTGDFAVSYVDDETLLIDYYSAKIFVNCVNGLEGVSSVASYCSIYSPEENCFYTFSLDGTTIGYFPRYNVSQLIEMANATLNQ